MKKFQATIHFEMDDEFMSHIPEHREYISSLIRKGAIDQYLVSMETQRVWSSNADIIVRVAFYHTIF